MANRRNRFYFYFSFFVVFTQVLRLWLRRGLHGRLSDHVTRQGTAYAFTGARRATLVTGTIGIRWRARTVCAADSWEVEVVTGAATVEVTGRATAGPLGWAE